jgi:hypothetical protein
MFSAARSHAFRLALGLRQELLFCYQAPGTQLPPVPLLEDRSG